ncbi:MAG: hypothetical protein HKN42_16870 [Granulosicoccus sp.]|nr:hypothetical protein [Granulosicoccus sp.]
MISRLPRPLPWIGLAILGLLAAWLLGNYQGQASSRERLVQLQSRSEQALLSAQSRNQAQQLKLEQLARARDVADARAAALQASLDTGLKQSINDAAELALYRRIASSNGPRELWIDAIRRLDDEPDVLKITLVQSGGRNRISGRIGVAFTARQNGVDRRWEVTDASSGTLKLTEDQAQTGSTSSEDSITVATFDLRFFQTLLVKADNITTMSPEYVEVSILPDGKRLKPSVQRFRWAEISEN